VQVPLSEKAPPTIRRRWKFLETVRNTLDPIPPTPRFQGLRNVPSVRPAPWGGCHPASGSPRALQVRESAPGSGSQLFNSAAIFKAADFPACLALKETGLGEGSVPGKGRGQAKGALAWEEPQGAGRPAEELTLFLLSFSTGV
jgi:hypothetical protein